MTTFYLPPDCVHQPVPTSQCPLLPAEAGLVCVATKLLGLPHTGLRLHTRRGWLACLPPGWGLVQVPKNQCPLAGFPSGQGREHAHVHTQQPLPAQAHAQSTQHRAPSEHGGGLGALGRVSFIGAWR